MTPSPWHSPPAARGRFGAFGWRRWVAAAAFASHAACIPPPPPPRPPPAQAWVIAGQSNAYGHSLQPTPDASGVSRSYGSYQIWRPTVDPNIHFSGTSNARRNSQWPAFAIAEYLRTGLNVDLVATARGGRCLVLGAAEWDPDTGWVYANMLDLVTGSGAAPVAMLWQHGECDAQRAFEAGMPESQTRVIYRDALIAFGERIMVDLGVPMVVSPISISRCLWTNATVDPANGDLFCDQPNAPAAKRVPIHDGTLEAVAARPDLFCLGPDSNDLVHADDNNHIYDVNQFGMDWSAAVAACGY